ncbi:MAG: phage tail sheath C-terminal domain-containing protein [Pseudomonadales bacterium]
MPTYNHPGVYIEELASGSRPIASVSSAIAIFIGTTANSGATEGEPTFITKYEDYEDQFGGIGTTGDFPTGDAMGHSVLAYFLNGGSKAYIAHLNSTTLSDYQDVFKRMLKIREITILCLPAQYLPGDGSGNTIVDDAIAHCEKMQNRMLIVDIEPGVEMQSAADVTTLSLPTSTYGATYYPWVEVSNPHYNAETNPGVPSSVFVPPSGFAAGTWAKTDSKRGIWKAPAGIQTSLLGIAGLQYTAGNDEQDFLNPAGVNALRSLSNYGTVVWGTRTLSTNADPEWRYIPVRRTAMFIEESLYNGIQWAVFEGNNHVLWSSLRANIEAFMNRLFRAGAFQGESTSDAYFVRCGLGDTMTQTDIDKGQVIVLVGFAPLKPAEFVILRLQQKVGS